MTSDFAQPLSPRANGVVGHPHLDAVLDRFEDLIRNEERMEEAWRKM